MTVRRLGLASPSIPSRRTFLGSVAAVAAGMPMALPAMVGNWDPSALALSQPEPGNGFDLGGKTNRGVVLGFGVYLEPGDQTWSLTLSVLDLDADPVRNVRVPLPHFAHGIAPEPGRPERLVTFQKRGTGASLVDLEAPALIRSIQPSPGCQFYGHGAFATDASLIYSTETVMDGSFRGIISVRDARSHERLGDFPSYGASPHDCHLIDSGRTLVVTNGGGRIGGDEPGSVSFVDVASQRLVERLEIPREDWNAGHLALSERGDLVVISSFREGLEARQNVTGGISLRRGDALFALDTPPAVVDRLFGETLSVCIDGRRQVFAATTPMGNCVTFWDLEHGSLLRRVALPEPKGVALTLNGSHYVISYNYEGRSLLGLWHADTLERDPAFDLIDTYISGSHLVCHDLRA